MILGFLAAALLLLTAAKFITKRLPFKQLDAWALNVHRLSGAALIVVAAIHAATVWGLLRQRPTGIFVAGIAIAACTLAAATSRVLAKRLRGKWIVIHRAATALACIGLAVHIALGAGSFAAYQNAVASIKYDDIRISDVADGRYEGECDVGYIYANVSVIVEGGRIISVDILEHRNERGAAAESIAGAVTERQSLDVDAVSGATNSSRVIKKAIEEALKKGER
jgi:uncharacterized protein with FMN-binding domain